MPRSTTEGQTPNVTQGVGDTDAELAEAVDFATLISMSSLNAPDVQKDRLTGRKEIAARLAEQAEAFGMEASLGNSTPAVGNLDPIFECQVADELELRGHTFEAELRYRRLQGHTAVSNRLALLLDAKGFHRESWQWYLQSARLNDINSLFRLATICWSRGDHGWAMRLAKYAVAQLVPDAYKELTTSIEDLVHQRTAASSPNHRMSVTSILDSKSSADTVYALGTVLLALANRPDLARLAYCSALARGHSLAAVSLLGLSQESTVKKTGNWRLSNMLEDALNDELDKYHPVEDRNEDLDQSLLLLKNEVQNDTFERLMQEIRAPTGNREDALERIIFTTQLITIFRGYGEFGCDTEALRFIDVAADIVCRKVHHKLATGNVGNAASLINMIREWSAQEVNNYGQSEQQNQNLWRKKKRRRAEEHAGMATSGTIIRLGREYLGLPPEHREVLILQLSGLYSEEVARTLDYREVDTDQMFADAVTRLQEAQQGEQIPTSKLLGAEVDSCFSADILKLIAFLPAWTAAGAPSWPRLSPNPLQLLRRQRARTLLALAHRQRV
jgi:hypothetical protein